MLKSFADYLVYSFVGLDPAGHAGEAFAFFIYDTLKIFLLSSP